MTQSTEQLQIKAERDLMVRSLDEWVMQTGAVVLNSSWHSELQSLMEMAFDKGVELEAAQAQPVARTPLSDEQIAGFNRYVVGTVHGRFARAKALVRMSEQYHGITQEKQG